MEQRRYSLPAGWWEELDSNNSTMGGADTLTLLGRMRPGNKAMDDEGCTHWPSLAHTGTADSCDQKNLEAL